VNRNVGGLDRIVRIVAGSWLAVVAVAAPLEDRPATAVGVGIAAAGLLVNAATGYCGGNALLGVDTSEDAVCPVDAEA
jgi:hypothetical protein